MRSPSPAWRASGRGGNCTGTASCCRTRRRTPSGEVQHPCSSRWFASPRRRRRASPRSRIPCICASSCVRLLPLGLLRAGFGEPLPHEDCSRTVGNLAALEPPNDGRFAVVKVSSEHGLAPALQFHQFRHFVKTHARPPFRHYPNPPLRQGQEQTANFVLDLFFSCPLSLGVITDLRLQQWAAEDSNLRLPPCERSRQQECYRLWVGGLRRQWDECIPCRVAFIRSLLSRCPELGCVLDRLDFSGQVAVVALRDSHRGVAKLGADELDWCPGSNG